MISRKQAWIIITLIVVLALVGWFFWRNRGWEINKPQAGRNIIAFGDSLVEGVGASPGKDFVSVLTERLDRPIINAGKSGDTTASALARLDTNVLGWDPRVVIVLLGGNDALRKIPKSETEASLAEIIEQIQDRGAAVLLLGVQGGIFRDGYKDMFASLAKKYKTAFVPNVLEDIFGHPRLMSDAIHPNDQGYAIMAQKIEPVLKAMLQSKQ